MLLESLARGGNDRTLSCVSLPRDLFSVEDMSNASNVGTSVGRHCAVAETSKEECARLLQIAPRTQILGIGLRRRH